MPETASPSTPAGHEPSRWPPPQQNADRLREELEAAASHSNRALLAMELGLRLEAESNPAQAVAYYELAAREAPGAALPRERLLYLARHGIDRGSLPEPDQGDSAVHAAEARAEDLLLRATVLADHHQRLSEALTLLLEAAELRPADTTLWLAIELAASQLGDDELRARALAQRALHAQPPLWRALLLKDLAALQLARGRTHDALVSLNAAIDLATLATFPALRAQETAGRVLGEGGVVLRALDGQAQLITRAMSGRVEPPELGVPSHRRSPEVAAACWLEASDLALKCDDIPEATRLLNEALKLVPAAPALLLARLAVADKAGSTEEAAAAARAQLELVSRGTLAAALWLRIAEYAADRGDGDAALDAVDSALRADPSCIAAQALKLDLLSDSGHAEALAGTLEEVAEQLETDEGKAHLYLLAAETWALSCGDTAGARAALSQCSALGLDPLSLARVARWLSAATNDSAWFEEATRRVLAAVSDPESLASFGFEHLRARVLRQDLEAALEAVQRLESMGDASSTLARLVGAWLLPLLVNAQRADGAKARARDAATQWSAQALEALAGAPGDAECANALKIAAVVRRLSSGQLSEAEALLDEVRRTDPSHLALAAASSLLCGKSGGRHQGAVALAECAQALSASPLAAYLRLRASLLLWHAGALHEAVDTLRPALPMAPSSVAPILDAMQRRIAGDDLTERRQACRVARDGLRHPWQALQGFALECTAGTDLGAAVSALAGAEPCGVTELDLAILLARSVAVCSPETNTLESAVDALDALAESIPSAAPMAASRAFFLGVSEGASPEHRLALATRWTDLEPGLPSAIERLAAAENASNETEIWQARHELARHLDPESARQLAADTMLARYLSSGMVDPLPADTDASSRLVGLEVAPPGRDPARRVDAVARAQGLLGEASDSVLATIEGFNALAAGDSERAVEAFRRASETNLGDPAPWEGLRACGLATGNEELLAEAYEGLGETVAEPELRAALWEEAAFLSLDHLGDASRGEAALRRSLELDIRRTRSFERLFRILRAAKEDVRLLSLVEGRLTVSDGMDELVKLHWERARCLRELGDRQGALTALGDVRLLEPDHVGALALAGEILIKEARFPEAAEALSQLAQLENVPANQRLMSGVAAADVYENKLGQLDLALGVLARLHEAGLTTMPVRERLARLAAKAHAWEQAAIVLEELMRDRDTREGRIEAARLALAICRDKLSNPCRTLPALRRLMDEAPDDPEGIDFMLGGGLALRQTSELLTQARDALFTSLQRDPMDAERIDRLARIAEELADLPLRQAALGALIAVGAGTTDIEAELAALEERVATLPRMAIDPTSVPELLDPGDHGPIADLFRELAPGFEEVLGANLKSLGLSKKERIAPKDGLPLRTAVAAWAGALAIGDFDLYIGGPQPDGIRVLAGEKPIIVVGAAVDAPLSPRHRQAIARELYGVIRGTTLFHQYGPSDLAALVHAVCTVGGSPLRGPSYALTPEFERMLTRELPRRYRKRLPDLAAGIAAVGGDVVEWVRSARASQDRVATLAAGDVSWVLAEDGQRGRLGATAEAQRRASRLLGFVLSHKHLELREKLGMGIR